MFPPPATEAALVVVTVVVARRLAPRLARARAPASLARLAALSRRAAYASPRASNLLTYLLTYSP